MKEIADILKLEREKQGRTLEDVSAQTKIQLPTLQLLESGDFSKFSNAAYLKGFIRQYARALHLNPDELLNTFNQANNYRSDARPAPVSRLDSNELTNKTNVLWFRAPSQFITIGAVVIILMLITVIYFVTMKIVSYSQETFKEPTTQSSSEPLKPEDTPHLESLIHHNNAEETAAATKAQAAEAVVAVKNPSKENNTSAVEKPPVVEAKPKMVTIEAKERVTIDAAWSTGKKETIKLSANSRHVFHYAEKIKLIVSDGGLVKISTHEKDIGIPGEAGKPITMNFQ